MYCANPCTVGSWMSCAIEIHDEVAGLCWVKMVEYVFLAAL